MNTFLICTFIVALGYCIIFPVYSCSFKVQTFCKSLKNSGFIPFLIIMLVVLTAVAAVAVKTFQSPQLWDSAVNYSIF